MKDPTGTHAHSIAGIEAMYWCLFAANPLPGQALTCFTLHWRHNDNDGVSNHQPHGCLLNRLFRRRSKKTSKLRVTGLCVGNSPGPVNSPHKGPVTRKMFPFDDVIMIEPLETNSVTFERKTNWITNGRRDPVKLRDTVVGTDRAEDIKRANGYVLSPTDQTSAVWSRKFANTLRITLLVTVKICKNVGEHIHNMYSPCIINMGNIERSISDCIF